MFQQGGCSCERVCQSGMLCLCSKRSERQRLWYEVCHQPFTNSHSLFGSYNPGEKSLGQFCNIYNFLSFLGSLLIQYILFEIFLRFSLPPPYKKLKLGKNSGYTRPTLFVGWGEGLDLCDWKTPQKRKSVPRLWSMIVGPEIIFKSLTVVCRSASLPSPSPSLRKFFSPLCKT